MAVAQFEDDHRGGDGPQSSAADQGSLPQWFSGELALGFVAGVSGMTFRNFLKNAFIF